MTSPDHSQNMTAEEFDELLQSLREKRDKQEATEDDYYDPSVWEQK